MKFSKLKIAETQIDKAIGLFIEDRDFICSLTLAGAAEEILGNILRERGEDNILAELHPWYQENHDSSVTFAQFRTGVNETRNELKHSHENPSPDYEVHVSEADAGRMLMRAVSNFLGVARNPTGKMDEFYLWVKSHERLVFEEWPST